MVRRIGYKVKGFTVKAIIAFGLRVVGPLGFRVGVSRVRWKPTKAALL